MKTKIIEVTIKFNNKDSFEYRSAEGFDLSSILDPLGLSVDGLVNADPNTLKGLLNIAIQALIGFGMKRFGM